MYSTGPRGKSHVGSHVALSVRYAFSEEDTTPERVVDRCEKQSRLRSSLEVKLIFSARLDFFG